MPSKVFLPPTMLRQSTIAVRLTIGNFFFDFRPECEVCDPLVLSGHKKDPLVLSGHKKGREPPLTGPPSPPCTNNKAEVIALMKRAKGATLAEIDTQLSNRGG